MATAAEIRARLEAELAGVAVALAMELKANLVEACPVDTGNARARFVESVGPSSTYDDGTGPPPAPTNILGYKLADGDVRVSNNTPYLPALILGSSSQAPPGWDLDAIERAQATIQAQYDGVAIDVTTSGAVAARGAPAAGNLASAYSPFGGDE